MIFDALTCLTPPRQPVDHAGLTHRLAQLGAAATIECQPEIETPADPRIGHLLSHRRAIAAAAEHGAAAILVLTATARFHDQARDLLPELARELATLEWSICLFGGWWPRIPAPIPACRRLAHVRDAEHLHAVAYHRSIFNRLLADWPQTASDAAADATTRPRAPLDRALAPLDPALVATPSLTTLPALLPFEPSTQQRHYTL